MRRWLPEILLVAALVVMVLGWRECNEAKRQECRDESP